MQARESNGKEKAWLMKKEKFYSGSDVRVLYNAQAIKKPLSRLSYLLT